MLLPTRKRIFETPRTPLQDHINKIYGEVMAAVDDSMAANAARMGRDPNSVRSERLFQSKQGPFSKDTEIIDI